MIFSNLKLATMTAGQPYGLIADGAVLVEDGKIAWAGSRKDAPGGKARKTVDCGGRLLTPGLIDCHTHIVYGGNRANEFEMRLNGAAYADIAKAGGGILSTVRATREATEDQLVQSASTRLESLLAEGVTTIEIKSGYGLDVETELKMLEVARKLGALYSVDVVTSYLGAHTFPAEYRDDHAAYVDLICSKALPAVASAKLADAVDAFCEGIAFSIAETEKVFAVAKKLGLPVKLHAEQLSNLGGARLAARYDALSVDHIEYLDVAGVAAIARSGTTAVLLPGAFYYLKEKQHPPVATLRAHKVPIAIATDLNPGSSPVHSLLTAMNMACVLFGLTPEEALRGVTANAAQALGLKDRGVIAPGMKADLVLWNAERPGDLAYPLGFN
ncbi:MAG: imidazolonepropionase, partial [Parvibaculaceae bacterium]